MIGDDFVELMTVGGVSFLVLLACDHDASGSVGCVLYGLVTMVDVGTLLIALCSLWRTIETLEKEKQSQKLRVLLRLRNVLVGMAGVWMGFNLLWEQRHADSLDWWASRWFYKDGAPILFNTIVLASTMVSSGGGLRSRCFVFRARTLSFMRLINSWKWRRVIQNGLFVDD